MDFQVIQDRMLLEVKFVESTSSTGIFLGDGEAENIATVLAVGPKVETAKVGDKVIIDPSVGNKISLKGQKLLVVRETDVFAILD